MDYRKVLYLNFNTYSKATMVEIVVQSEQIEVEAER